MKKINCLVTLSGLSLLSIVCFADDLSSEPKLLQGKNFVLNAKGTASSFSCDIPPTNLGTTQALCFNVPLYNLVNGQYVGTLKDALTDFRVNPDHPNGIIATVRSHFQFHDNDEHQLLVTSVIGSVQPFLEASKSMSHLTGFIPNPGDNNVVGGTGRFANVTGSVRESGAVNLSKFKGQPGDEINFDLIWVINLN